MNPLTILGQLKAWWNAPHIKAGLISSAPVVSFFIPKPCVKVPRIFVRDQGLAFINVFNMGFTSPEYIKAPEIRHLIIGGTYHESAKLLAVNPTQILVGFNENANIVLVQVPIKDLTNIQRDLVYKGEPLKLISVDINYLEDLDKMKILAPGLKVAFNNGEVTDNDETNSLINQMFYFTSPEIHRMSEKPPIIFPLSLNELDSEKFNHLIRFFMRPKIELIERVVRQYEKAVQSIKNLDLNQDHNVLKQRAGEIVDRSNLDMWNMIRREGHQRDLYFSCQLKNGEVAIYSIQLDIGRTNSRSSSDWLTIDSDLEDVDKIRKIFTVQRINSIDDITLRVLNSSARSVDAPGVYNAIVSSSLNPSTLDEAVHNLSRQLKTINPIKIFICNKHGAARLFGLCKDQKQKLDRSQYQDFLNQFINLRQLAEIS